jgi:hypothetical protein
MSVTLAERALHDETAVYKGIAETMLNYGSYEVLVSVSFVFEGQISEPQTVSGLFGQAET